MVSFVGGNRAAALTGVPIPRLGGQQDPNAQMANNYAPATINSRMYGNVNPAMAAKFAPLIAAEGQYDQNKAAGQASSQLSNPNINDVYGSQNVSWNPDGTVSVNRSMNPGEQQLYDTNTQMRQQMGNVGQQSLGRLASNYGQDFNTSNLPGRVSNVQMGDILSKLDTSGLPQIPGAADLGAFRQQAQDAAYKRNTEYLDPQFQRQEQDMQTRLANQGITPGSEAYGRDVRDLGDAKQRAYDSARAGAVQQGLADQQAQYNMGANTNAQLYGQLLGQGQFQNQAQEQGAGQGFQNADLANQARDQQFQENAYLRDLPLNELKQLMPQYNTPEFQNFQGQQIEPMDLQGAVANIMGLQNQKDAVSKTRSNQLLGSGIGAAATVAAAF